MCIVSLQFYITHTDSAEDAARYQTVFAKNPGAVAAPTAALHFDDALLAAIDAIGVSRSTASLHVGTDTFQSVETENMAAHQMHSGWYEVRVATPQAIAACHARGGRVIAVGTASVRAPESWAREIAGNGVGSELRKSRSGSVDSALTSFSTRLFITPGVDFNLVDMMVTNFHLPTSSLMMLVSAFAGYEHVKTLYRHAIDRQCRFLAMATPCCWRAVARK